MPDKSIPSSTPCVLVHGMWSCQSTWGRTVQALQQQGHTVLPYELPEHGQRQTSRSKLGRLGIQHYVADLVEWVEHQAKPPILIGHSMGGLISLLAAAELSRRGKPVPGVIMVTPAMPAGGWGFSWTNLLVFLRPCALQLLGWRAFELTDWEARFGLFHDSHAGQALHPRQNLQAESGRALMQVAWWFLNPMGTTRVKWADVTCPVKVYLGQRDRIVPAYAAKVLNRVRDVDITTNARSSHMVFDDPSQTQFWDWLGHQVSKLSRPQ